MAATTTPTGDRAAAAPGPDQTMRAIVQREYGTADVLHLESIECPAIGADEVLVAIRAAGLDRGTWHLMTRRWIVRHSVPAGRRGVRRRQGIVRRVRRRSRGRACAQAVDAHVRAGCRRHGLGADSATGTARAPRLLPSIPPTAPGHRNARWPRRRGGSFRSPAHQRRARPHAGHRRRRSSTAAPAARRRDRRTRLGVRPPSTNPTRQRWPRPDFRTITASPRQCRHLLPLGSDGPPHDTTTTRPAL